VVFSWFRLAFLSQCYFSNSHAFYVRSKIFMTSPASADRHPFFPEPAGSCSGGQNPPPPYHRHSPVLRQLHFTYRRTLLFLTNPADGSLRVFGPLQNDSLDRPPSVSRFFQGKRVPFFHCQDSARFDFLSVQDSFPPLRPEGVRPLPEFSFRLPSFLQRHLPFRRACHKEICVTPSVWHV